MQTLTPSTAKPHVHANADPLQIVDWAVVGAVNPDATEILVDHGTRPTPIGATGATGAALVTNGHLGADVIRVPAGGGFSPHTHPGDHILMVIAGLGTITYDGRVYPTRAGQIYMIEGLVPHAVAAITDHVLISIGSPHMPVHSPERTELVDYAAVAAPDGHFTCLICDKSAVADGYLHDADCVHCPCERCVSDASHLTT